MMEISRRQFSLLLGCTLLSPSLLATSKTNLFASAIKAEAGGYELLVIDQAGQTTLRHRLPARAHHIATHPHEPILAAVGRRPETFIDVVDYRSKALIKRITSAAGQHFYGHAIYSPDGRWLISTENEIATGRGLIVIRDTADNYRVIKQFSSGGIGPHELKMMADEKTLVVANGGILTHPDKGREKLNLESMRPSLAYIDLHTGTLSEQAFMPDKHHQLSIRHFDVNQAGTAVIGLQYQGSKTDDVPLVAFHRQGQPLSLVRAPSVTNQAMKHYCGSARFDKSGSIAAISSPRGNLVTFWQADTQQFIASTLSRDGCGLAHTDHPEEFLISTGRGYCYRYNCQTQRKEKIKLSVPAHIAWDNHMSLLIS